MSERIRVIIADDEANYRKAIVRTLSMSPDIELVAACMDGQEALEACLAESPDVLMTDINMPHMTGIELTRKLLRVEKEVRVVILTVQEDDDSIFEALKAGATGYLLKTSTPQEVIDSVRCASRGEAKITPRVAAKVIEDFRRFNSPQKSEEKAIEELFMLSDREQQVLTLVAKGMRNKEIADKLEIAEKTVKNHVSNILKAMHVNSRTEAAMRAVKGS